MLHDAQNEFTKEAIHLQGLLLVQFNLAKQFHLFLAQVLSLWTTILIGRMLLLILILTIIQLIDLHFLLTHGSNSVGAIILMNNWLKYLANLLTHLILIRLPVWILIQGELKPASLILSVALSLTSLIISCFNVAYISMLTWCNLIQTLQKSTSQWPTSLKLSRSLTVDSVFIFSFSWILFFVLFSFILLFLERLGLGFISHAVTSVTNWWRSHKTDHGTWKNEVEGTRIKWRHTAWITHAGLMLYS